MALEADRWEGASIAEIFAEVIPFLVAVYQQKRGLVRAFIVRGSNDPQFAESASRLGKHISERLTELLLDRREEITHPDPAIAVDFGLRMMFDTLDQSTLFADVERMTHPLTPQETARELIRLYLSYLGVERTLAEQGLSVPTQ